jgi:hypothetical protein
MLVAAFGIPAGAVEYSHPGVYVQEAPSQSKPIEGVNKASTPLAVSDNRTATMNPAAAAAMIGPGMEADTNRFGSDYKNFEAANAQQCQAACAKEAQCKAWTWVKPGVQGPNAKCWLKNAVPAKSANACCISGVNTQAPGVAALSPKAIAPVAQPKAPLAHVASTSAPIRNKNLPAQQSQQRVLENVRQQNSTAASTYRAVLTEQGAESLVEAGILKPEVLTLNKQRPAGHVFRPGAAVAIQGRGLGTGGQARLLGGFRKTPVLIVNDWRPSVVYARLPDDVSGEEDLDNVRLEIQPSGRQPIVVPGVRFEAAREVTLLKDIPQRYVRLTGQQAEYATGGQRPNPSETAARGKYAAEFVRDVRAQSAIVIRYLSNWSTDWFDPGTDIFELPLRPGFMIESYEFWHGRTDTHPSLCGSAGEGGGQYFKGRYGAALESENLVKVDWGVWRCHRSPVFLAAISAFDWNFSGYGLNVYVVGPRGVSPWK